MLNCSVSSHDPVRGGNTRAQLATTEHQKSHVGNQLDGSGHGVRAGHGIAAVAIHTAEPSQAGRESPVTLITGTAPD